MQAVVIYFGQSTAGLGALGINGSAFLVQLLTFGLAYLVLRKWAFGPILKVLQERRTTIEKGVQLGEQMQKQQAELTAQVAQKQAEARQQADSIITAANDIARTTVLEAEASARVKADRILKEAEATIAQNTARARQQLEHQLIGLISEVTETIIEEKIDVTKDAELISKALKGQS